MKSGKLWKTEKTEGYQLSVVNWGNLAWPCHSNSQCPSIVRDKDAPFFWVSGGHLSHEGLMTCFMGGQRVLPASAISQILRLEIFSKAKYPILEQQPCQL